MSTFTGFSEEDLQRIKSADGSLKSEANIQISTQQSTNIKKIDKLGAKPRNTKPLYKLPEPKHQSSDDYVDINFDKCRLSIKTPSSPNSDTINNNHVENEIKDDASDNDEEKKDGYNESTNNNLESSEDNTDLAPDIVRGVADYTEDDLTNHKVKIEELQLRQRLMEEQNKKRKEMLAKALADRTKQTEEQVLKLDKIKKELQVLDGQFSHDVAVLRKKIDQACHSYADAEKQYLKVEKEFLQAKINLQKEKERKELLTEHLCTLITHNETRKAQKLETLMLQLIEGKGREVNDGASTPDDETPVIVDGVDVRTGKIVEMIDGFNL